MRFNTLFLDMFNIGHVLKRPFDHKSYAIEVFPALPENIHMKIGNWGVGEQEIFKYFENEREIKEIH